MVFSWKSTLQFPLNLGQKATDFRSNEWVFTQEKNHTVSHTNKPSFQPGQWWIKDLLRILWDGFGLKCQPKLNRHNDECLVEISDQNTHGVMRNKSWTESEQNWFFENKTSWFFFPVSSFCDLFMEVPPYHGANNMPKYLCEIFQRNTWPGKKLQKVGRNFTSFASG